MAPTKDTGLLTVAALREGREDGTIECLFHQRQRIFTLPASARTRDMVLRQLRVALDERAPVEVTLDASRGVVERVARPSEDAVAEFERARILLEHPDRTSKIDVASIDPTTFNIVGHYLDVATFKLCKRIIPSYKKAKEIFDFCAAQSCHLPGPPAISHCIPFQYVHDGCYARAHKMRQIITEQYGYCCEKVFSFAIDGNDTLAVRANKWGGCCVTWWYHVAPLVRVGSALAWRPPSWTSPWPWSSIRACSTSPCC